MGTLLFIAVVLFGCFITILIGSNSTQSVKEIVQPVGTIMAGLTMVALIVYCI